MFFGVGHVTAVDIMESDSEPLGSESISSLEKFLRDILAFHLIACTRGFVHCFIYSYIIISFDKKFYVFYFRNFIYLESKSNFIYFRELSWIEIISKIGSSLPPMKKRSVIDILDFDTLPHVYTSG